MPVRPSSRRAASMAARDVLDPGGDRRQLGEAALGHLADDMGEGGLAGSRRPPQQQRHRGVMINQLAERGARRRSGAAGRSPRPGCAGASAPRSGRGGSRAASSPASSEETGRLPRRHVATPHSILGWRPAMRPGGRLAQRAGRIGTDVDAASLRCACGDREWARRSAGRGRMPPWGRRSRRGCCAAPDSSMSDPVPAERDPAVRRRPVLEGVEQEPEL